MARWFRWSLSVADPSAVGASLAPPCFRFYTPLIEADVRICRIQLSEKTHAIAIATAVWQTLRCRLQVGIACHKGRPTRRDRS